MRVLTAGSPATEVDHLAGGKGRRLYRLTHLGVAVPTWSVVGLDVFCHHLRQQRIDEPIDELAAAVSVDTAAEVAARIGKLITDCPPSEQVVELIAAAYAHTNSGSVAIRSSVSTEDGFRYSFAGQFDTYLDVCGRSAVVEHVLKCWASAFSERSLRYRLRTGLPLAGTEVAVVVQRMVHAERSGILFTANPVLPDADADEYIVCSGAGPGDGIVNGTAELDTTVLDAGTGAVVSGAPVDPALHPVGRTLTAAFGGPQDIEWAVADGKLWVLQSRPLTQTFEDQDAVGAPHIWDNANIVESFGGVTSTLTYTFAADVYARVYRGYARSLRVPRAQRQQMEDWLPVMLGHFHGRVYYNLVHWYRMVRLAPGYRVNRKVLEVALGVEEPLDDEVAESLRPFEFRSRRGQFVYRMVSTVEFIRRALGINRAVKHFHAEFTAAYATADAVDYDAISAEDVYRRFTALQRELAEKWGPMMVLDAVLLHCFAALHTLIRRWLPDAPDWFTWAAASPGPDVVSAEPATALTALAATMRADPELDWLVRETPVRRVRRALAEAGYHAFLADIDSYVKLYGHRSPDELKLEVPDLRQDPSGVFVMLRAAVDCGAVEQPDAFTVRLRGVRRAVYELVRHKTRACLADRERLRFCRTRAFGLAKRMVAALGADLARNDVLDDWRDVFHLRVAELSGCFEGAVPPSELKSLVRLRKLAQSDNEGLSTPSRFVTHGAAYRRGSLADAGFSGGAALDRRHHLVGTPSCPGVVEGRAVVTTDPKQAAGAILLAYRTDPGWVPALPSVSALLIERGSPLTHVAIVARELGIPTVVGVKDLTRLVRTGDQLRVDGGAGEISVLAGGSR